MDFGVRAKLFTSFGTLITLIAGVGFVGWQNTKELATGAEDLYKNQVEGAISLSNWESDLWRLRYGFPQFLVQPEQRQAIRTEESQLYQRISQNLEKYRNSELSPEEEKRLEKLETAYKRYITARPKWFELVEAGKLEEAATYRAATTTPFGAETVELLEAQINLKEKVGEDKYQEIVEKFNNLTILLSVTLILALVIAGVLSVALGRNITEVIFQAVKNITTTSSKIAVTVEQQESVILQQADSVDKTTTTIEELGVFALQSADKAETSAQKAQEALILAEGGTQTVGLTVEGISELKDQVIAIANQIVQLSKQTVQISTVSDLVADLANQTNILALNAGVEAARAGDQGRGFAVVANEIRKLADQSKKSAEQINALVYEVQEAINSTVMVTDEGTKKAKQGIKLAEETGDVFVNIANAVNNVFLNSQQIAITSKQQAVAVQQVVADMNAINLGAKETAVGIVQVKDATQNLNHAAENLQNLKAVV